MILETLHGNKKSKNNAGKRATVLLPANADARRNCTDVCNTISNQPVTDNPKLITGIKGGKNLLTDDDCLTYKTDKCGTQTDKTHGTQASSKKKATTDLPKRNSRYRKVNEQSSVSESEAND